MATNPYFRSNYNAIDADQRLYENLIIESIKAMGRDMYYIPRQYVAFDTLYGEDKLSSFEKHYILEFYVKDVQGFGGDRDFLGKFGLEIRDEMNLTVSRSRFNSEITSRDPTIIRPREGDLILFATDGTLFEITFVEDEEVFYQAGRLFTWEINLKKFELAGEKFNTGINSIDYVESFSNTTTFTFDSVVGDFEQGELIQQGSAVAEVVSWNGASRELVVMNTKGSFEEGVDIVGVDSGAIGSYDSVEDVKENSNIGNNQAEILDNRDGDILDFTENNPYAE